MSNQLAADGLDDSVLRFIGRLVLVEPVYGYGWHDGTGKPVDVPAPRPFMPDW